jgi:hypothetical protein
VTPGARVTARAVARLLHGRECPAWRRADWARCPGWGACLHVPFEQLRRLAQEALVDCAVSACESVLPGK